jgi:hypothetical protein
MSIFRYLSSIFCIALVFGLTVEAFPTDLRAADDSAPVTLEDSGSTVTLSNGILTATLSKAKASITALRFRSFEMLASGYYSMDGGKDYITPSHCRYKVKPACPTSSTWG